ncbi:hypothetical protein QFC21_007132 [Naganishia friedmannii]|uniref:Uncharacterized protein n=1 Tax=Naganishia friedmannii TaxID=89922 RepID=A0ACC2UXH3_9TREE|nr:hypothetical protein QFC21_007132 [Naganishia friedmannii]
MSRQGNGDGEGLTEEQLSCSTLPTEVLAVVAEHLIGQHAFGTTANLNLASKSVHHETLPVLYETYFHEVDMNTTDDQPSSSQHLPLGIKYAEYIFFQTGRLKAFKAPLDIPLPTDVSTQGRFGLLGQAAKVVMSVASAFSDMWMDSDLSYVGLYRPLSSATAFRILATPFEQTVFTDHQTCLRLYLVQQAFHTEIFPDQNPVKADSTLPSTCLAQSSRPKTRDLESIRNIILENQAHLHDRYPNHIPLERTSLRLHDTEIVTSRAVDERIGADDDESVVATLVESMKLLCNLEKIVYWRSRNDF